MRDPGREPLARRGIARRAPVGRVKGGFIIKSCHRPALALQACATDHFLQSCLQTSSTGHASAEPCDFTNPSKSQNFGQYRPKWSVLQAMGPRSVKPIALVGVLVSQSISLGLTPSSSLTTENKKGSIREGGTTARRGRAGLSQAQCSAGGAVTRVASALMLFMTAVLRLPVF